MKTSLSIFAFVFSAITATAAASDANTRPPALRNVGIEQRLDAQLPLDVSLRDENGTSVLLSQFFEKKPVILNFVYHNCPMLCPTALDGLTQSLNAIPFDAGKQFDVVTISIDPNDTSAVAATKKAEYLRRYHRTDAAGGWHFLTGDAGAIRKLAEAAGFHYNYDPETKQFAHTAGIMIVTPQGKLARYFYGIQFNARDLRLSIVEASANKIGSPVDELLLFCSRFDPSTGKYGVVIMKVIQIAGLATVLILGTVLGIFLWKENHPTNRTTEREPPPVSSTKGAG